MLDELDDLGMKNALIVMDNAKYHKCLPPDTPSGRWSEKRLQDECIRIGVDVAPSDYKSLLWGEGLKVRKGTCSSGRRGTCSEAWPYCGVYPPQHSDLQPIELIWAEVKGKVGKRYDMTSFADVKNCIDSAQRKLEISHEHLLRIDEMSSDEESSAESGDENDGDDESDSSDEQLEMMEQLETTTYIHYC
ncbi:hypothetical protein AC1031_017085 [Aphanomyces cochlioides]|nr:hypothetical protein AC1031_017085 [Aphanomyces cochlioides]